MNTMENSLFELLETTQDIGLRETLENKIAHLNKILHIQNVLTNMYNNIEINFIEPNCDFDLNYFDVILTNTITELNFCSQEEINSFIEIYNQFVLNYKNLCKQYAIDYNKTHAHITIEFFCKKNIPSLEKELFNIVYCARIINNYLPKTKLEIFTLAFTATKHTCVIINNINKLNIDYNNKLHELLYKFRIELFNKINSLN